MIVDLCKDFGWSEDEKPISLHEFWKVNQSLKGFPTSGKSLDERKSKNSRKDIGFSQNRL